MPEMTPYENFIAISRYARWLEDENRREAWDETVDRYVTYMREHLVANHEYDAKDPIFKEVREAIVGREVMPSMRALMTAGPALARNAVAAYNCSMAGVNDQRVFDEAIFILMSGTGFGFSVQEKHVGQLPLVPERLKATEDIIVVDDSKEGWAQAYRELIDHLYNGRIPSWDVSKVRPKGARLKTFGGRASGPQPLLDLFQFTIEKFTAAAGRRLRPIEVHDIMCKIGDIVVSGGVRRSALISLSDLDSDEMAHAKSGAWWERNGQRALANNSAVYYEKPSATRFMREWLTLAESGSGERGIYNLGASRKHAERFGRNGDLLEGTNPCVTADTTVKTSEGYFTVAQLVGRQFEAVIDGVSYETTEAGFFSTGVKPVFTLRTKQGHLLDLTEDHRVMTMRGWIPAGQLVEGDLLRLTTDSPEQDLIWSAFGSLTPKGEEEVFDVQVPGINAFDANGLYVHNCGEISLRDAQFCNLTEVVIRGEDSVDDVKRKVRLASIMGTWQASLTDLPYLRGIWKKNIEEEALLGVSLTGIYSNAKFNNPDDEGLPKRLAGLRKVARDTNAEEADKIGIARSAAISCTKPSGTVGQLAGVSSGIHPWYASYFIRRVRGAKMDPISRLMIDSGVPHEDDVMNDQNVVFSFPMAAPKGAVYTKDITAIDHLRLYLVYREHWAEHTVSITVNVKDDEWPQVGAFVYENFDRITGVSFLPAGDGHTYQQAPYEEISKEEYEALAEASPKEVRFADLAFYETEDGTTGNQALACTAGGCDTVDLAVDESDSDVVALPVSGVEEVE